MAANNRILGTIEMNSDGVNLVISGSGAYDHCVMRTRQLSALTHIISGEGADHFELHSVAIKDNVMWLVNSLACEVEALLPIILMESEENKKVAQDD